MLAKYMISLLDGVAQDPASLRERLISAFHSMQIKCNSFSLFYLSHLYNNKCCFVDYSSSEAKLLQANVYFQTLV